MKGFFVLLIALLWHRVPAENVQNEDSLRYMMRVILDMLQDQDNRLLTLEGNHDDGNPGHPGVPGYNGGFRDAKGDIGHHDRFVMNGLPGRPIPGRKGESVDSSFELKGDKDESILPGLQAFKGYDGLRGFPDTKGDFGLLGRSGIKGPPIIRQRKSERADSFFKLKENKDDPVLLGVQGLKGDDGLFSFHDDGNPGFPGGPGYNGGFRDAKGDIGHHDRFVMNGLPGRPIPGRKGESVDSSFELKGDKDESILPGLQAFKGYDGLRGFPDTKGDFGLLGRSGIKGPPIIRQRKSERADSFFKLKENKDDPVLLGVQGLKGDDGLFSFHDDGNPGFPGGPGYNGGFRDAKGDIGHHDRFVMNGLPGRPIPGRKGESVDSSFELKGDKDESILPGLQAFKGYDGLRGFPDTKGDFGLLGRSGIKGPPIIRQRKSERADSFFKLKENKDDPVLLGVQGLKGDDGLFSFHDDGNPGFPGGPGYNGGFRDAKGDNGHHDRFVMNGLPGRPIPGRKGESVDSSFELKGDKDESILPGLLAFKGYDGLRGFPDSKGDFGLLGRSGIKGPPIIRQRKSERADSFFKLKENKDDPVLLGVQGLKGDDGLFSFHDDGNPGFPGGPGYNGGFRDAKGDIGHHDRFVMNGLPGRPIPGRKGESVDSSFELKGDKDESILPGLQAFKGYDGLRGFPDTKGDFGLLGRSGIKGPPIIRQRKSERADSFFKLKENKDDPVLLGVQGLKGDDGLFSFHDDGNPGFPGGPGYNGGFRDAKGDIDHHDRFVMNGLPGRPIPGRKGESVDSSFELKGDKDESILPGLQAFKGYDGLRGFPDSKGDFGLLGRSGIKGPPIIRQRKSERADSFFKLRDNKDDPVLLGVQGLKGDDGLFSFHDDGNPGHPGVPGYNGGFRDAKEDIAHHDRFVMNGLPGRPIPGRKGESVDSSFELKGDMDESILPGLQGFKGDYGLRGFPDTKGDFGLLGRSGIKGPPVIRQRKSERADSFFKLKENKDDPVLLGVQGLKGDDGLFSFHDDGNPGFPGGPGYNGGFRDAKGDIDHHDRFVMNGLPGRPIPGRKGESVDSSFELKGDKDESILPGLQAFKGYDGLRGFPDTKGDFGLLGRSGMKGPPIIRQRKSERADSFFKLKENKDDPVLLGVQGLKGDDGLFSFHDDGNPGFPGGPGYNGGFRDAKGDIDHHDRFVMNGLPGRPIPGRKGESVDSSFELKGDKDESILPGLQAFKGYDGLRGFPDTKGDFGLLGRSGIKGPPIIRQRKSERADSFFKLRDNKDDPVLLGVQGLKGDDGLFSFHDDGNPGHPGVPGYNGGFRDAKEDIGHHDRFVMNGLPGRPIPGRKGESVDSSFELKGDMDESILPGLQGFKGDYGLRGFPSIKGDDGFPVRSDRKGERDFPGRVEEPGLDDITGDTGLRGVERDSGTNREAEKQERSGTVIVKHSRTTSIPTCSRGHNVLWDGFSLLYLEGNRKGHQEDLGLPGSCLTKFITMPFTVCDNDNVCNHAPRQDKSYWLSKVLKNQPSPRKNDAAIVFEQYISRCVVCEAPSNVITLHSQSRSIPECPTGWSRLWIGFSFVMYTVAGTEGFGQSLSSTGSCLEDFSPTTYVECYGKTGTCNYFANMSSLWLTPTEDLGQFSKPVSATLETESLIGKVSRCQVCIRN